MVPTRFQCRYATQEDEELVDDIHAPPRSHVKQPQQTPLRAKPTIKAQTVHQLDKTPEQQKEKKKDTVAENEKDKRDPEEIKESDEESEGLFSASFTQLPKTESPPTLQKDTPQQTKTTTDADMELEQLLNNLSSGLSIT